MIDLMENGQCPCMPEAEQQPARRSMRCRTAGGAPERLAPLTSVHVTAGGIAAVGGSRLVGRMQ